MRLRCIRRDPAFTRADVLVLVGMLGLLGTLLFAGVGMSRSRADTAVCLASLGELTRAWWMYAQDQSEQLPYNTGVQETAAELQGLTFRNWVNNVMSWGASASLFDASNTNVDWALRGGIGPYLDGRVQAYQCPADRYLSPAQRHAGWTQRLRSRSMNCFLGRWSPVSANDSTAQGRNTFQAEYRQYLRLTDLSQPARTFVFLDEHPDSINDGYFMNTVTASNWGDIPASYHEGAGAFGFADGHAQMHLWRSSKATRYPVGYRYPNTRAFDAAGRTDFTWYLEHASFERAR